MMTMGMEEQYESFFLRYLSVIFPYTQIRLNIFFHLAEEDVGNLPPPIFASFQKHRDILHN